MTKPRPSVIVLAWNRWDLTRRCLESIGKSRALGEADVILVDNGSTDETPREAPSFPWVRVVRLPQNLGYVLGNNVGIAESNPESDVVLLNNDVRLEDPDWLGKLAKAAHSDPSVGIVGPRLVLPDGRLIHAGTYIVPETCLGQTFGREETDIGQFPGIRDVQGIVFAVAYVRRGVLRRIGPLPTDYVSFFEDTDYCLRARAAGFRVVCTGDLTVTHETGATLADQPEERQALFDASRDVFRRCWAANLAAAYDVDLAVLSTEADRQELGELLIDLLLELDACGVRVAHRDADRAEVLPPSVSFWGRGHFARVFAEREAPAETLALVIGEPAAGGVPSGTARAWGPLRFNDTEAAARRRVDPGVPDGDSPAGRQHEIRIPLPVATSYFHPGAWRAPRRGGGRTLLARFSTDDVDAVGDLLSAFARVSEAEPGHRLLLVMSREVPTEVALSLMDFRPARDGSASFQPDILDTLEAAALYRSVDALVSWRRDLRGARERWQALACHTPVIFVGPTLPTDGTGPYLVSVPERTGETRTSRVEAALRRFVVSPYDHGLLETAEFEKELRARSLSAVARTIREGVLAIHRRIASDGPSSVLLEPVSGENPGDLIERGPAVEPAKSRESSSEAGRSRGAFPKVHEADAASDVPSALIFLHLPKCGGTSLDEMLRPCFREEEVFPDRFNTLTRHAPDSLRPFRYFSGHFDRPNVEHVPEPRRVLTLLREPRARILSLYRFWRAHREAAFGHGTDLPWVRTARATPLLGFLRHAGDGVPEAIDNAMTRNLAGSGILSPNRRFSLPPEEMLFRAREFLESMTGFGLLEEIEEFVGRLRSRLGLPLPNSVPHALDHRRFGEYPHLDSAEEFDPVSAEVEAELERLTCLDQRLYAWARERIATRHG